VLLLQEILHLFDDGSHIRYNEHLENQNYQATFTRTLVLPSTIGKKSGKTNHFFILCMVIPFSIV